MAARKRAQPTAASLARPEHKGEQHHASRLRDADVQAIRSSSLPDKELAARYGVTAANIYHVRKGHSWRHLPLACVEAERGRPGPPRSLTPEQVREIHHSTESHYALGKRFGVPAAVVSQIRHGLTYRDLAPAPVLAGAGAEGAATP